MRIHVTLATVAIAICLPFTVASAAVLETGRAGAAGNNSGTIFCDIVSLNTSPKQITIDVLDCSGNVQLSSGPFDIAPSTGESLGNATGCSCRFTVSGSAKRYRAMAINANGSHYTVFQLAY